MCSKSLLNFDPKKTVNNKQQTVGDIKDIKVHMTLNTELEFSKLDYVALLYTCDSRGK